MSSFTTHLPALFLVGLIVVLGYYFGKEIKLIKLPAVIGYMILGVIFGPSLFNIRRMTGLPNAPAGRLYVGRLRGRRRQWCR